MLTFLISYMAVLVVIPFYVDYEVVSGARINLERLMLSIIFILFFTAYLQSKGLRGLSQIYWKHGKAILFPMVFYYFWRLLGSAASGETFSVFVATNDLISNLIVFYVFLFFIFDKGKYRELIQVCLVTFGIIFLIGVVEFLLKRNFVAETLAAGRGGAIEMAQVIRNEGYRAKATFEHPLTLGHYLVMVAPILLLSKRLSVSRLPEVLVIFCCVSFLVFVTGSRATLLIFLAFVAGYYVVSVLFSSAKDRVLRVAFIPILLGVGLVGLLFGITYLESISGRGIFESYTRIAQIVNGFLVFQEAPFLGHGAGGKNAAQLIFEASKLPGGMPLWESNASTIDNWFLSVALESGLPGVVAFLVFNLIIFARATKIIFSKESRHVLDILGLRYLFQAFYFAALNGFVFMSILSIFTMHPFYFICLAGLSAIVIRVDAVRWMLGNYSVEKKRVEVKSTMAHVERDDRVF